MRDILPGGDGSPRRSREMKRDGSPGGRHAFPVQFTSVHGHGARARPGLGQIRSIPLIRSSVSPFVLDACPAIKGSEPAISSSRRPVAVRSNGPLGL